MSSINTNRKIRVAFLISNFDAGGAETQFWNLVRGLDRGSYDVHVILIENRDRTATYTDIPETKFKRLRARFQLDPIVLTQLVRYISRNDIQILQSILFMDNQFARLAGFFSHVPVVTSVRGELLPILGKKKTQIEYLMQRLSKVVVTNSKWLKHQLVEGGSAADKIQVIYNGIDTRMLEPEVSRDIVREKMGFTPSTKVVGIVGRHHPMKDHETFFEALRILIEEDKQCMGLVVGGGPDEQRLKQLVREMGINDNVVFAGRIHRDMGSWYRSLDVLCLTSKWGESFPNVIIEAMACGVPVVATDVSAVREIIDNGVDGLVAPIGDSTAIAALVQVFLRDAEVASNAVREARKKVSLFSNEKMLSLFSQLYRSLVV